MTIIIGLNGFAQSGKDTAGAYLVEKHGFERRAFADKLRAVAYGADPIATVVLNVNQETGQLMDVHPIGLREVVDTIGWDRAKVEYPAVRDFLQKLGTEGVRENLGQLTWINAATADLGGPARLVQDEPRAKPARVVFTDARFPNEYDAIHELGGQVWRIERPGTEPAGEHVSEAVPSPADIDRTILNDGTVEDLHRALEGALTNLTLTGRL